MDDQKEIIFFEKKLWQSGIKLIAGIDEAGRGPLAGPVVAAAVIFPKNSTPFLNRDSKKITEKQREKLFKRIIHEAVSVGIGFADSIEIDEINILNATKLAVKRAINSLKQKPEFLITDALNIEEFSDKQLTLIKGDEKSFSCAAASIVAKVTRDYIMKSLDSIFPDYNLKKHKGYPTKEHISLIIKNGISPIHRRSFGRVKECQIWNRRGEESFPLSLEERLLYYREKFQELIGGD
ncbi:ribonuclease HII [Desulfurobacterium atlanticum]|uniref:Ribonuclease HII n=1 Tax=Desulfurobacterium atlanticum TaxID=240169 RepID=A0A238ZZF5_9BACT|nr:ribonuclease HII [Desulfurobacterium atlanticum]SNR88775.1 RNase HII [Desulfurobacterium atlanticum]